MARQPSCTTISAPVVESRLVARRSYCCRDPTSMPGLKPRVNPTARSSANHRKPKFATRFGVGAFASPSMMPGFFD
ncbi:hypothetical protein RPHASCH2410_CH20500 [Rhizobium phaseoli Ch24-10]|nr:hypothetical protein RPHASCH2410_CH20500 [Rhizobium phaseoli Ch24-10]